MDTVFANWLIPMVGPPIARGFMRVSESRIVSVGKASELPVEEQPAEDFWRSHRWILTPGLINGHTHLELTYAESPLPAVAGQMVDWLLAVIAKSRDVSQSSEESRQARIAAGIAACLASGTTCVNDICRDDASAWHLARAGLRARVSLEFFHPGSIQMGRTERLEVVRETYLLARQRWSSGRLRLGLSPHSPYNVSPTAWRWAMSHCEPEFIHTHWAESRQEMDWLAGSGPEIDRLHQTVLGRMFPSPAYGKASFIQEVCLQDNLLSLPTIAAHGVYLSDADIQHLQNRPVGLVHCPRSNWHLQGETLDASRVVGLLPLALGTDSRLSAPDLDIRREARWARRLHGWSSEETARHLTVEAARALHGADEIGSLVPGKAADYVIWQVDQSLPLDTPEQVYEAWLDPQSRPCVVTVGGRHCLKV